MRYLCITLLFAYYSSFSQERKPIVALTEFMPSATEMTCFVIYSDGTVLRNENEVGYFPKYLVHSLDSAETSSLLKALNFESFDQFDEFYDCSGGVTDRTEWRIIYFKDNTKRTIWLNGYLRRNAYRLAHNLTIEECEPKAITEALSILFGYNLTWSNDYKEWKPSKFADGPRRYNISRFEWYKENFGGGRTIRYILPNEDAWLNE
jgi:hypothetical protein